MLPERVIQRKTPKAESQSLCVSVRPRCHFLSPLFVIFPSYVPLYLPFPLFGRDFKKVIKVSVSEFCYFWNLKKDEKGGTIYLCTRKQERAYEGSEGLPHL